MQRMQLHFSESFSVELLLFMMKVSHRGDQPAFCIHFNKFPSCCPEMCISLDWKLLNPPFSMQEISVPQ